MTKHQEYRIQCELHNIAEKIRHEPFHSLTNNCIIKSFKFRKACKNAGIDAAAVIAFGIVELNRFGLHGKFPFFHSWGYANHTRIEVARPLDERGPWGTYDIDLTSVIGIWIW